MKRNCFILFFSCFLVLGVVRAQVGELPSEVVHYAEMVLYNGQVITADDEGTVASAVAIRDKKFLAVGDDEYILRMAGPKTSKINLEGRSVVPGFIDNHYHAWVGQISKRGEQGRTTFKDKASGLEEVRQLVEAMPPGEWVTLSAPRNPAFFSVTRKDLDPIAQRNPLVVITQGQDIAANSLAMELIQIPPDTGGLVKDPNTGEPTGQLGGWAGGIFQYETRPWPSIEELIPREKQALARQSAQGLTTLLGRAQGLSISVLRKLWLEDELPVRVRVFHEFVRLNLNGEVFLKRVGNLTGLGDDLFKIVGLTVAGVDGSPSEGAALTSQPKLRELEDDGFGSFGQNRWLGHAHGSQSPYEWDDIPQEVKENSDWMNIILANRYGWTISALHSSGEESTRIALKAYETASLEKPLEGPWGIDHSDMQTPRRLR